MNHNSNNETSTTPAEEPSPTARDRDDAALKRQADTERMVSRPCMKRRQQRGMQARLSGLASSAHKRKLAREDQDEGAQAVQLPRSDSSHRREQMHQAYWDQVSNSKVECQNASLASSDDITKDPSKLAAKLELTSSLDNMEKASCLSALEREQIKMAQHEQGCVISVIESSSCHSIKRKSNPSGKGDLDRLLAGKGNHSGSQSTNYLDPTGLEMDTMPPPEDIPTSRVGAHRIRPTHANSSSTLDDQSMRSIYWDNHGCSGEEDASTRSATSFTHDASHSNSNLAIANPVSQRSLPIHTATEVDVESGWKDETTTTITPAKRQTRRYVLCCAGLGLIVLVTVVLLLATLLPNAKHQSASSLQTAIVQPTLSPTMAPTTFLLDLPGFTRETILNDQDQISPQSRAYQWMQNDPWLANYSQAKQLQRFFLATLYYETNGEEWAGDANESMAATPGGGGFPGGGGPQPHHQGGGPPHQGGPPPGGPNSAGGPPHQGGPPPPGGGFTPGGGPPPHQGGGPPPNGGFPPQGGGPPPLNGGPPPNGGAPPHMGGGGGPPPGIRPGRLQQQPRAAWLSYDTNECYWYSPNQDPSRHQCNADGLFVSIDLEGGLQGTIPPQIGLLGPSLRSLYLGQNELSGTIPLELFQLSHLDVFQIARNKLTGTIPTQFGLLQSSLQVLHLKDNHFVGTIPTEFSQLSRLIGLVIEGNQLSGTLEHLPTTLEKFNLLDNRFGGSIPTTLGQMNLYNTVLLGHNQFTGSLPSEIGNWGNVTSLLLMDNQLSGSLPSEIARMTNLETLDLSGNQGLTGELPVELTGLFSLMELDLKGTGIRGTIPEEFCGLDKLAFDCSEALCGCFCACADP